MHDPAPIELDFFSDTITRPTAAMRAAMAAAEVGDDVMGLDPSVLTLEQRAAERLQKEAAVFVPSGHMANFAALIAHAGPGGSIVAGEGSHVSRVEAGLERLGRFEIARVINEPDGTMAPDSVRAAVDAADTRPTLLTIENTHNFAGGRVLGLEASDAAGELARELGLALHLDGARIFNAEVASGVPAARLARSAQTVCFCLSKGLSAPVGSLLCGSDELIRTAREARTWLGGGMRQAGVLAAAGLVALETMVERMAVDHERARALAAGLAELGLPVDPATVDSNIVLVSIEDAFGWRERLLAEGVSISVMDPGTARLVTHADLPPDAVDDALLRIRRAL